MVYLVILLIYETAVYH